MAQSESASVQLPLPLSNRETTVLELYDSLQQLRMEIALINARTRLEAGTGLDEVVTEEEALQAESKLTETRSRAVHNGADASPLERDLLPLVEHRDEISKLVAKHATESRSIQDESIETSSEATRISRKNIILTEQLLNLKQKLNEKRAGGELNAEARGQINEINQQLQLSRRRWKVVKGVVSAMVVGSGVDWASDPKLIDMVLDLEDT